MILIDKRTRNEIVEMIRKISGKELSSQHFPPVIEPRITLANIDLIKKKLGWEPKISFKEGLNRTYNYFMNRE